jgi:hypothetical protein
MGFLAPLFLAGALTAAVPIILHLLKREPEARIRFAAVDLLRSTPVEQADRRRLRQLLLLALRITALVMLALVFARPFFMSGAAADTGVTVVALDVSLSMSAPELFANARRLALDAIDEAPSGHQVGVITFADQAVPASEPSADRTRAAGAVEAARAGFGGTRYRAAIAAAAGLVGERPGRIVLVTDLQASGWDPDDEVALPDSVAFEVVDAGPSPPNLSVSAARLSGDRLLATVRSSLAVPHRVTAHLEVDGAPAGDLSDTVPPDGTVDLAWPAPRGTGARVFIDDAEGLSGDNERHLLLGAESGPEVLVVTNSGDLDRDAFYLEQALATEGPDGTVFRVTGIDGARVSAFDESALDRYGVVVVLSTRGLDARGRSLVAAYARGDGGVLLAAGPDVDPEVAAGALGGTVALRAPAARAVSEASRLAPADLRHPVFRAFAATAATLGLVRFSRTVVVDGPDCQVIARFTAGAAALVDCDLGGRVMVLASDLDGRWNDFPLHATFVPFVHEALRFLTGGRTRVTSYAIGRTPPGVPPVPGIVRLPGSEGGAGPLVAVNVDPRESDAARVEPAAFQDVVVRLPSETGAAQPRAARQQEEAQRLWWYGLFVVAAALVAESILAARTA